MWPVAAGQRLAAALRCRLLLLLTAAAANTPMPPPPMPLQVVAVPDTSATAGQFDFSGFKNGQLWVALITFLCECVCACIPPASSLVCAHLAFLREVAAAAATAGHGPRVEGGVAEGRALPAGAPPAARSPHACSRRGPSPLPSASPHADVDFLDATGTFYSMVSARVPLASRPLAPADARR